jgi:hypothetical protein
MKETLDHIHSKDILVVDLNENNFMLSPKFDEVYFLDVDSFQTPHYPATALMETVRDRHMKNPQVFSKETDWFALAIVTFQMFIGIHPFKGKHPAFEHLSTEEKLDQRMKKNISVFNKDVKIPPVCYPFSNIPKSYLEWYKLLFEQGARIAPPKSATDIVVAVVVQTVSGSNQFKIEKIMTVKEAIIDYFYSGNKEVIVTNQRLLINGMENQTKVKTISFTPKTNTPIGAVLVNNSVDIVDLVNKKTLQTITGKNAMQVNNRIYIQGENRIYEVIPYEQINNCLISVKEVANILENATKMFSGVVLQNLLGTYYWSFFPESKNHYQLLIEEFNGYVIVEAKYENQVLMVIASKNGKYDHFIIRLASDWENWDKYSNKERYDLRIIKDISYTGLNFTVLDNGTCVRITEDEKIEMFSNRKDNPTIREIADPAINSNMTLHHRGAQVLFAKDKELYSITMEKK